MIDAASLLEYLTYVGSFLVIAVVIREVGRPGGAMSFADLLALYPEPKPHRIREEEPVRWNLEGLQPRRYRAGVANRLPEPIPGGIRRTSLAERQMSACEGC
jgi:hypothetical protein